MFTLLSSFIFVTIHNKVSTFRITNNISIRLSIKLMKRRKQNTKKNMVGST